MVVSKESTGIMLNTRNLRRMLATAEAFDIDKDGHYDPRSAAINLWCSPTDKPVGWRDKIYAGALAHPRDIVGTVDWQWPDEKKGELAELFIEVEEITKYEIMLSRRRDTGRFDIKFLAECMAWCKRKVVELVQLSRLAPHVTGLCCPWCDFVLPVGVMLNGMIEHVQQFHEDKGIRSVWIGDELEFRTDEGIVKLKSKEEFLPGMD